MDATLEAVSRLRAQGILPKEIARRLKISDQKVRKILITLGQFTSPRQEQIRKMRESGMSIDAIAKEMGYNRNTVLSYLPYQHGPNYAEYPTLNAIRIRQCRERKRLQQSHQTR